MYSSWERGVDRNMLCTGGEVPMVEREYADQVDAET